MLSKFWRFCFRLLYNEFAFTYDYVSRIVSLGHWRNWQRSALRYLPAPDAGMILELGHGTGDMQIELLRAGYQSVALDLSPYMGRLTRRKLRQAGLNADLVRSDAQGLPYRANAFAAAVCTFPTSYILVESVLDELARVLQSSGRVVVVLAGQLRGKGLRRQLIGQLYRLTGQGDELLGDSAVRELFSAPRFCIENHIVTIGNSAAQVVVLTAVSESIPRQSNVSLDYARHL